MTPALDHPFLEAVAALALPGPAGRVKEIGSARLVATGPALPLGALCSVGDPGAECCAEVVAVNEQGVVLVPLENGSIALGDAVRPRDGEGAIAVGDRFGGRAIDPLGRPIDGQGPIVPGPSAPPSGRMPAMLDRIEPSQMLPTGVRAIDCLMPLACGQRIGIFAASGVGKTSLIEQLAAQIDADRVILCLVGERGREVEAFWRAMGARADRDRFTLVAATSDTSAPLRARATEQALALAEYWRDAGEHVLLIIDSVTRLAMALREMGLAAGEPPTLRAYTPNVFAALPRLVERCGATPRGAVTAVMTVLSETDDVDDPIVEVMKSLLDGHIILSRTLADRGHFPAIDINRSISRLATRVMPREHAALAAKALALASVYEQSRLLIESGMYQAGGNAEIDRAIAARDPLNAFLRQRRDEAVPVAEALRALGTALAGAARHG